MTVNLMRGMSGSYKAAVRIVQQSDAEGEKGDSDDQGKCRLAGSFSDMP